MGGGRGGAHLLEGEAGLGHGDFSGAGQRRLQAGRANCPDQGEAPRQVACEASHEVLSFLVVKPRGRSDADIAYIRKNSRIHGGDTIGYSDR